MTSELETRLQAHIDAGTIPGVIALVGRGEDVRTLVLGDTAVGGPSLRADAIVRIQSMTKAVTTAATLIAVGAGELALDDPVQRWLPELADRRVLRTPDAGLDDVIAAERPITVRDLLINGSGYGAVFADSPISRAMEEIGVASGPEPVALDADEWLGRLGTLPLVHQPGRGFRYHSSFQILGILLQRAAGEPLDAMLRRRLFDPIGMPDTGLSVPDEQAHRLPAAYRLVDGTLVETEPAGGGFWVGEPPFDTAHGELVSTAADYHRFLRVLVADGRIGDEPLIDPALVAELRRDQVTAEAKTPDSFMPGFWDTSGWGYGVAVETTGEHAGRWTWSGGQGTTFLVDPDGTIVIVLTQVELGEATFAVITDAHEVGRTLLG